jgi:arylsulfatase A-like enzyme
MAALNQAGLAENTLVIFTADHGVPFPRAKCTLYDPGLQVPLILRWPKGPWRAGTVHEAMISNVDYVPTLCDLLDLPPPADAQGRSYAALLRGQPCEPRRELFAEMTYHDYYDPLRAIRTERHKLIVSFCHNLSLMNPSQQYRPKTIPVVPADPSASRHAMVQLYDLQADPLEQRDLAKEAEQAEVTRDLLTRLHRWMMETRDPLLDGIPMPPIHHEALVALRDAAK